MHTVYHTAEMTLTCVPFETGRKIAPAPATFALALAMDGR